MTPSCGLGNDDAVAQDSGNAWRRRHWSAAVFGALLGFGPSMRGAPVSDRPTRTGQLLSPTSFYNNLANMRLVDQDGRAVQPTRFLGKTVLVNFVFTGCSTVCPVQTSALVQLQERLPEGLKRKVHFLSISVDPLGDTPAALKAFATRMKCDLRLWSFVVGKPNELDRLSEQLALFRPDPGAKRPDDHNTALWLVDARGELRMRYSGNPPDVPRLLKDLPLV